MTAITRFVNTGSTSGGTGTTNNTTGANRAYPTLDAWNTAESTNLVTAGDSHTVQVDGAADTVKVDLVAWTADDTNFLKITAHANSVHGGKLDLSKYHIATAGNYDKALGGTSETTIVDGLQIAPSAGNNPIGIDLGLGASASKHAEIINCILKGFGGNGKGVRRTTSGKYFVVNNLIYDWNRGLEIGTVGSGPDNECALYNNTVEGCTTEGMLITTGQRVNVKNNLLSNNNTDYTQNSTPNATTATNISSDATSPETGLRNITVTFTDLGGEDYSTSDSDVVGAGTDLSGDSIYPFSTDINGDARGSSWDIGAFQEPASGSSGSGRNPGKSGGMLHLEGGMQG